MVKFVTLHGKDYLYMMCMNHNPIHVYLQKYLVIDYMDSLTIKKVGKDYDFIHNKKTGKETVLEGKTLKYVYEYITKMLESYQNEINNKMNMLD